MLEGSAGRRPRRHPRRHDHRRPRIAAGGPSRLTALAAVALLIAAACAGPRPDEAGTYVARIQAARAAKDAAFRDAADSPVPQTQRATVLPLPYFDVDPSYRVPAVLEVAPAPRPVSEVPTSTGARRRMERIGTLRFTLKGTPMQLVALHDVDSPVADRLFVPFTDLTSGTESYPGGRYLDLDATPTGIYDLDFNRAYHPYCLYDSRFDCPFPPRENRLATPIRAGERLPDRR